MTNAPSRQAGPGATGDDNDNDKNSTPGHRLASLRRQRQLAVDRLDRLYARKHADEGAASDPGLLVEFLDVDKRIAALDASIRKAENDYLERVYLAGNAVEGPDSLPLSVMAPPAATPADRFRARGEAIAFIGRAAIHLGRLAQGGDIDAFQAVCLARAIEAVEEGRFDDAMRCTEEAVSPAVPGENQAHRIRTYKTPTRWELAARLVHVATRAPE